MLPDKRLKSYILFILGALLLILGLISCEKSAGDKLYGRWQFRYCEFPGENGTFANDSIFYSFDRGVFELQKRDPGTNSTRHYGVYETKGDSLFIEIRLEYGLPTYHIDIHSVPYFFYADSTKYFLIEKISRKEMILSTHDTVYHFNKF